MSADPSVLPRRLTDVTAMVLCGGGSTRFGADKTDQPLGSTTVLGHLLGSLPADWPVVAVGTRRSVDRFVTWTREEPPGGGPLTAIAAGLALVWTPIVLVAAGDMPFAGLWAVRLADAQRASSVDATAARDEEGRENPLLCAYKTTPLRKALPLDPVNQPAHVLLQRLEHGSLMVPEEDAIDVDTPAALAVARHRLAP